MIAIKEVMTRNVITVQRETPIYEALDLLERHHISGLPVVNDEMKVVGILSEKDVLELLLNPKVGVNTTVEKYMSRKVTCFEEDDDIFVICQFLIKGWVRRVPIVKDGKLTGIISRSDMIRLIMEAHRKMSDYRFH